MCAIRIAGPRVLTERLMLRPPECGDAARLAELANDFEVGRMLATLPHPYDREDAEAFVVAQGGADGRRQVFVVEHPCCGLVGVVGFNKGDEPYPEVGYWIGRPYWGRGYATEALRGALRWAAEACGARAVASSHFVDNDASAWVLVKAGFLHTGVIQPRMCMARDAVVDSRMMIWLA